MRLIIAALTLILLSLGASAQPAPVPSSNPVGGFGVPTVGIYCMDSSGNAQICSFGGGGGSGGAVTQSGTWQVNLGYNGSVVSPTNLLGITDPALDALISSSALKVIFNYNGAVVSPTNLLGVTDAALDALISSGALKVSLPNVTPAAGTTTAIVTGGTAITIFSGTVHGGFVCNPLAASDQNIATAEVAYVNLVTTATANGRGSNAALQPGQCFTLPAIASVTVSAIAATAAHAFSVEVW